MNVQKEIQLLTLSGPGIAALLALIFFGLWSYQRTERYLTLLGGAYLLYALGLSMQILRFPADLGINALITAVLYLIAMILLCQGVLSRHGQNTPYRIQLALSALILFGLYYFYYVDENVLIRIYILNFGIGFILLSGIPALSYLRRSKLIDQILYWTCVAFTFSFFVRTPLTLLIPTKPTATEHFNASIFWLVLQVSLLFFVIFLAVIIIMAALHDRIDILRKERDVDALTGCLNRRGFFAELKLAAAENPVQQRYILLADLDHFKNINDTYGHAVGDNVLRLFVKTVRENLSTEDVIGRIGGEEFAFLLNSPHSAEAAIKLANKLCLAVSAANYVGISPPLSFTSSFGLGAFYSPIDAALQQADDLLYLAKNSGRNNVAVSPQLNS